MVLSFSAWEILDSSTLADQSRKCPVEIEEFFQICSFRKIEKSFCFQASPLHMRACSKPSEVWVRLFTRLFIARSTTWLFALVHKSMACIKAFGHLTNSYKAFYESAIFVGLSVAIDRLKSIAVIWMIFAPKQIILGKKKCKCSDANCNPSPLQLWLLNGNRPLYW